MNPIRIFISSVQSEFMYERKLLRDYLHGDTLFRNFFEVFLFEDLPAVDRRPDRLFLDRVEESEIYVGLFGKDYGNEDGNGISPTEREFDHATTHKTHRIVFLKDVGEQVRHPKMQNLIHKAQSDLIRKRFKTPEELKVAIYSSLIEYLVAKEKIRTVPFDSAHCIGATLEDLDTDRMKTFVRTARRVRQFPLSDEVPPENLLKHLDLLNDGRPTNAAVLLFGKSPQKFLMASEIKCAHFYGTDVEKPIPSLQVYRGTVFDVVDQAVGFVLSKINRSIGTRSKSARAARTFEIPEEAVFEAIVNAVAHRDYTDSSSVQVMLFSDRLEVRNSGKLPPEITLEDLRTSHSSFPRNPLVAQGLYLVEYIERMGTGTLDMIKRCIEVGLPEPEFRVQGGFVTTLPRSQTRTYTITASTNQQPVSNVDILMFYPNGTWKRTKTNKQGEAIIKLHSVYLPMTVYAAAEGFAAYLEHGWRPEERQLSVELIPLNYGGSVIFCEGVGQVPGITGRLNPILDTHKRTYLYASNILINHGQIQPVSFDYDEELILTDASGFQVQVCFLHMVSQSALLQYQSMKNHYESDDVGQESNRLRQESNNSRQGSTELRILSSLINGPMSRKELSEHLGHKKISGQLNRLIPILKEKGEITYLIPDKPQSRLQKYLLTDKGKLRYQILSSNGE